MFVFVIGDISMNIFHSGRLAMAMKSTAIFRSALSATCKIAMAIEKLLLHESDDCNRFNDLTKSHILAKDSLSD